MQVYPNPYTWNKINLDLFFGRSRLMNEMCQRLIGKMESFAVIGGRRMGKTTLLRKIEQTLDQKYGKLASRGYVVLPVYVDFQAFPPLPSLAFVWAEIMKQIESKAKKLPNLELGPLRCARETLESGGMTNPFEAVCSGLVSLMGSTLPGSLSIVVMMDEVEKLLMNEWCDDFWRNWRALVHNTPGVSRNLAIMLSGSVELCEIAKDRTSSLFGVLEPKLLEVFSEEDSLRLITEPGNLQIHQSSIDTIIQGSGGHPFIIQYLMSYLYENQDLAQQEALDNAAKSFVDGQEFILRTWWSQLGLYGQDIYRLLASVGAPVKKALLISKWLAEDVNWALDVICSSGIGKRSGHTSFVAAGTVFRQWAQERELLERKAIEEQALEVGTSIIEPDRLLLAELNRRHDVELKLKITELKMRSAISCVYQAEYGNGWEEEVKACLGKLNNGRDIGEIQERCRSAQAKYASPQWAPPPELIHYTALGHLECLISSHWDKFNFIFGIGREARRNFSENFAVVARMRNELGHPLPLECAIPETELMRTEVACDDILAQIDRGLFV